MNNIKDFMNSSILLMFAVGIFTGIGMLSLYEHYVDYSNPSAIKQERVERISEDLNLSDSIAGWLDASKVKIQQLDSELQGIKLDVQRIETMMETNEILSGKQDDRLDELESVKNAF